MAEMKGWRKCQRPNTLTKEIEEDNKEGKDLWKI